MPTPTPDLGGASPIWTLIVLAIVVGPLVWAIMKDINDMRTWRGSRR